MEPVSPPSSPTPAPTAPVPTADPSSAGGKGAPRENSRESLAQFLEFASETLGIECEAKPGALDLSFDSRDHAGWPKPYRVNVATEAESVAKPARRQLSPRDGARWIWNLAQLQSGALCASPAKQPAAVHEFAQKLFDAYQIDNGQIRLAGCSLTETPFLRLTRLVDGDLAVEHTYFTQQGEAVKHELLDELGLAELRPLGDHPPACTAAEVSRLLERVNTAGDDFAAATLIGAKRAEGALQFDIGEQCAQINFSGWTASLIAPPFHCAASGIDTYHLAALDDGRIVAAEAIETCSESGERVLGVEMVECSETGKRVGPTQVASCPATGKPVLKSKLVECLACCQPTSPAGLQGGVCSVCRGVEPVKATDPLVAPLLEKFPKLAGYKRLFATVSDGLMRVEGRSWLQRLLVVVRETNHEPVAVATRSRFSAWRQLPAAEWPSVLGGSSD